MRQIKASKGLFVPLCLPLFPSRDMCAFLRNAACASEVLANQLCNLKDKRSVSQKGTQSNPQHLQRKRWQDLHSISDLWTLTSFASLCASTLLPLGHRQRSKVKGIYLLPLSGKQANKNYNLKTERGRGNWLSASN